MASASGPRTCRSWAGGAPARGVVVGVVGATSVSPPGAHGFVAGREDSAVLYWRSSFGKWYNMVEHEQEQKSSSHGSCECVAERRYSGGVFQWTRVLTTARFNQTPQKPYSHSGYYFQRNLSRFGREPYSGESVLFGHLLLRCNKVVVERELASAQRIPRESSCREVYLRRL